MTCDNRGLRIIRLRAENVKRLTAVDITPHGDVVQISGRNAAGKSSVLDAIEYALGGRGQQPPEPIRRGAASAVSEIDLGDLRVTRKWTQKGTYLEVTNREGIPRRSPQAVLDELVGTLTFDPLAFARQTPREQRETLLAITGLGPQLEALDADGEAAFDERTVLHQTRKRLEGQLAGLPHEPAAPAEPVSLADLLARMRALQAERDRNASRRTVLADAAAKERRCVEVVAGLERSLADLEAKAEEARKALYTAKAQTGIASRECDALRAEVAQLAEPDLAAVEHDIANAEQTNRAVERNRLRREAEAEVAKLSSAVDALTGKLRGIDEQKSALLAGAHWPVAGLGFSAGGVTFGGIPFEQASQAEQLRTSLAIGMALNPKLRVLLIRDGSLLDSASFDAIRELAGDRGYQVWIEVVDETGTVGIVIEDGAVVAVNDTARDSGDADVQRLAGASA